MDFAGKSVLITGGTGSFGHKFTEILLNEHAPRRLIVFSRDELKQYEMQQDFNSARYPAMRYFIGDVRDRDRLCRAFDGVDVVVHAAALKQVPTAEYNPLEVVRTNVLGAQNVIDAAIDTGVSRVLALSTDKAAHPINLYGATKLCADKMFVSAQAYSGTHAARFSVVRYGNVIGSRGSVIPLFMSRRATGKIPITDERMTRFWITLERGVRFVLNCLTRMTGGEIFIPKLPSMRLVDLATAIAPGCELESVGIRPGEKLHEVLITPDDARSTIEYNNYFAILPQWKSLGESDTLPSGRKCEEGFCYSSETNSQWLTRDELLEWTS